MFNPAANSRVSTADGGDSEQARDAVFQQAQRDIRQLAVAQGGSATQDQIRAASVSAQRQLLPSSMMPGAFVQSTAPTGLGAMAMTPSSYTLPDFSLSPSSQPGDYNQILSQMRGLDAGAASLLGLQQVLTGNAAAVLQRSDAEANKQPQLPANNLVPVEVGVPDPGLVRGAAAVLEPSLPLEEKALVSQPESALTLPPEELRTLVSAGVRIKGRTATELRAKAQQVKKRRKESAARSRQKKTQVFEELEGENRRLHEENERLKNMLSVLEGQFRQQQQMQVHAAKEE